MVISLVIPTHFAVPQTCNFSFHPAFDKLLTLFGVLPPYSQPLVSASVLSPSLPNSCLTCQAQLKPHLL